MYTLVYSINNEKQNRELISNITHDLKTPITAIKGYVEGIMDGINTKNDFRNELGDLLAYLNLKKEMYVTYNTKYKDIFFTPDMTSAKLQDIFDNWRKYFTRSTPPWGLTHFGSIRKNEDNLRLLADFLARQSEVMNVQNQTFLSYNIFGDNSIGHDKKAIGLLSQLDILTYPTLHLTTLTLRMLMGHSITSSRTRKSK